MKQFIVCTFFIFISLSIANSQTWQEFSKVTSPDWPSYEANQQYGYSVAIDGDYAVVGAPSGFNNKGMAYILHYNGMQWVQEAELRASDATPQDSFGNAVSISGNVIVIGAYRNDANGINSGAAYVYEMPINGWLDTTENAKLTALNGSSDDEFGNSVSISGNDIVIGAHQNDASGANAGMAYVFTKPLTGWSDTTETAKLTVSSPAPGDSLGYAVSISGNDITIGAPRDSTFQRGAIYIYSKPNGGWTDTTETARLIADNYSSLLGICVSISGNTLIAGAKEWNRGSAFIYTKPTMGWIDTTPTAKLEGLYYHHYFGTSVSIDSSRIIVGAFRPGTNVIRGAAYLFTMPSTGWIDMSQSQAVKLSASNILSGSLTNYFGFSVGISGSHIIVGASHDKEYGSKTGAAYMFEEPNIGWISDTIETEKKVPVNYYSSNQHFGTSVSIDGDFAVVGTPSSYNTKGAAYVLRYNGNSWEILARLMASDSSELDYFGTSVDISQNNIIVGAYQNNDTGAAYVFTMPPTAGWIDMTETAKLTASDGGTNDHFGKSVSISGDNIVVGAPGANNNQGAAYVFTKPFWGWWLPTTEDAKLTASDGNAGNQFGISVSIFEDDIVVGAKQADSWAINNEHGAAYVFSKPTSDWTSMTETAKLYASDGDSLDYFGTSVSVFENSIVIGAPGINNSKGAAYIFTKPVSGWVDSNETAKIIASDGLTSDNFGNSINISKDIIVVGAIHNDNINGTNTGAAYVYSKPSSEWIDTTENIKIIGSNGTSQDFFGTSVYISDSIIIIGSPRDEENGADAGAAYFFKITPTISIEKIATNDNNIKYYPNPTNDILTIESESILKHIEFFDLKGCLIKATKCFSNKITINTQSMNPGIYLSKVITKKGKTFYKKIVKL